jgi:hypothetical protein
MDMKQTMEGLTPATERLPYWDSVLQDARPSRARWAAPRLAIVAAVLGVAAVIAVAPWKSGERAGVLDRALAAVGDGSVVHVVFRFEPTGTVVDLATGESRLAYPEREAWWDPSRGLHESWSVAGMQRGEAFYTPQQTGDPHLVETLAGFTTGYRKALESGDAHVAREGVVSNRPVYWIRWEGHEVAVDRETAEPVYVHELINGKPGPNSAATVVALESLPAGAGDFTVRPETGGTVMNKPPGDSRMIDMRDADGVLGSAAFWLGPVHAGLTLGPVTERSMPRLTRERGSGEYRQDERPKTVSGVALRYQGREPNAQWLELLQVRLARGDHLRVGHPTLPEGKLFLSGSFGSLRKSSLAVVIEASSPELVLSAARALRPLSAGSGAGG